MQERDDPLGASPERQREDHRLQVLDVPRDDVEDRVGLAGHEGPGEDLGRLGDEPSKTTLDGLAVGAERDLHVDLERKAGRARVKPGVNPGDQPGLLQPADAMQRGGG